MGKYLAHTPLYLTAVMLLHNCLRAMCCIVSALHHLCAYCLSSRQCVVADPFLNDQNFILSVLSLEELGATGNKVCQSSLPLHLN